VERADHGAKGKADDPATADRAGLRAGGDAVCDHRRGSTTDSFKPRKLAGDINRRSRCDDVGGAEAIPDLSVVSIDRAGRSRRRSTVVGTCAGWIELEGRAASGDADSGAVAERDRSCAEQWHAIDRCDLRSAIIAARSTRHSDLST